jgi:hypothetical protein
VYGAARDLVQQATKLRQARSQSATRRFNGFIHGGQQEERLLVGLFGVGMSFRPGMETGAGVTVRQPACRFDSRFQAPVY